MDKDKIRDAIFASREFVNFLDYIWDNKDKVEKSEYLYGDTQSAIDGFMESPDYDEADYMKDII